MGIISRLFKSISAAVLTQWLNLIDFINFDSAACSSVDRQILIDLALLYPNLFQKSFLSKKVDVPLSVRFVFWLSIRGYGSLDLYIELSNQCLYSLSRDSVNNITTLLSCLSSVKSLKMTLCAANNVELLAALLSKCPNLEILALTNSVNIDLCVEAAAKHCPLLKSCNFSRCENVSELSLSQVCCGCPLLSKLGLNYCSNVTRSLLLTIAVHCANMQDLSLEGCTKLVNQDIHILSFHCRFPLTRITFYLFQDLSLRTFSWYRGRELKKLKMSDSHKVTNAAILELSAACPDLTNLNMSYCRNVTDAAVLTVSSALSKTLQILSVKCLYEITDDSVMALTSRCHMLKEFHVCGNTRITSQSLRTIQRLGHSLKSLSLIAMSLQDDVLVDILTQCRVLEELDVGYNSTLTDGALVRSLPHCRSIERFQLQCCDNISDPSLEAIAQHCVMVTELEISHCKKVSYIGVLDVLKLSGKSLRLLDISGCQMWDFIIRYGLQVYARGLTSLDVGWVFKAESVIDLIGSLKRLRKLKTSVSLDELKEAMASKPDLWVSND